MKRSCCYLFALLLVASSLFVISPMPAQDRQDQEPAPTSNQAAAVDTETVAETIVAPAVSEPSADKPVQVDTAETNQAPAPATSELPDVSTTVSESTEVENPLSTPISPAAPATTPETPAPTTPAAPVYWKDNGYVILGAFFGILILSIALAQFFAATWRMPDYTFRFFALLVCLFGGFAATFLGWHKMTLGIDLRGGVVLVYNVSPGAGAREAGEGGRGISDQTMDSLATAIGRRINPAGVREIAITKLGSSQIKIIIPEAEDAEVDRIQRVISESGSLTFRILASTLHEQQDGKIIEQALRTPDRQIKDENNNLLAEWTPVSEKERAGFEGGGINSTIVTRERNKQLEVLCLYNDGCDVTGEFLQAGGVRRDIQNGEPVVAFSFNSIGESKFMRLTGKNLPEAGQERMERRLGIIMNDMLYSAPNIKSKIGAHGVITFGRRHTKVEQMKLNQEIDDLINVLNAGSLPAELSKEPVSKQYTGALLGEDTIRKGQTSMLWAAACVAVFMLVYYRYLGIIACFCVVMNLVMTIAVMLAIRAAFTLPGLAGLVLTVGMAVDANILIFERLREEFAGGASMKMAIRNAFSRATSAIVDSNLTTVIVGVILYSVGTEQVRGFAVTLILGVIFSMYTAIYCSRTIMDVIEKNRWMTKFNMMRLLTKTNINFMKASGPCLVLSAIVCMIGLSAVALRGNGIYGIDFNSGVAVEAVFKHSQKIEEIREKLGRHFSNDLSIGPIRLTPEAELKEAAETGLTPAKNTHFVITTSTPQPEKRSDVEIDANVYLKQVIETIKNEFGDGLVYNFFDYKLDAPAAGTPEETPPSVTASLTVRPGMSNSDLTSAINAEIESMIQEGKLKNNFAFTLKPTGNDRFHWSVQASTNGEQLAMVLDSLKEFRNAQPYFPTSTTIGKNVASDTRTSAAAALIASLICIVIYIWLRFHRVIYGLAAVITLAHNVLIVLGLVALSKWLAPYLGFLQINEFKIDLTMIAAFLTVIGYSINDTIILFDRIRENRGKNPNLTKSMVNAAINQTLSRTILTSVTTAFVLFILYFWGGDGIHSFSFALLSGIVVGTYGSIYIASVLLLMMSAQQQKTK